MRMHTKNYYVFWYRRERGWKSPKEYAGPFSSMVEVKRAIDSSSAPSQKTYRASIKHLTAEGFRKVWH